MTQVFQCDHCKRTPQERDELMNWLHVQYGVGSERVFSEDYCSLACATSAMTETEKSFAEAGA